MIQLIRNPRPENGADPWHHADPACQGARVLAQLGADLALGGHVPRHAAHRTGECGGPGSLRRYARRLIRRGDQQPAAATATCSRSPTSSTLASVSWARKAVSREDLERHHPPGNPAVREEADRGLRVVRRPLLHAPRRGVRVGGEDAPPGLRRPAGRAARVRRHHSAEPARLRQGGERDLLDGRRSPHLPANRRRSLDHPAARHRAHRCRSQRRVRRHGRRRRGLCKLAIKRMARPRDPYEVGPAVMGEVGTCLERDIYYAPTSWWT